jgi:hypothetical protein
VCPGSLGTSAWVVSACPYLFHTGGRVCCDVLASILVRYVQLAHDPCGVSG